MGITSIPADLNSPVEFNFNTSGSIEILKISSDTRIKKIEVIVDEAFDDPLANLSVGITGELDKFVKVNENDLGVVSEYDVEPNYKALIETILLVTVSPGTSTQGKGIVIINYF